ncbi:MAG TPA: hypothetical protein VF240_02395, partial [Pyrinomonadaceae bacterium]
MLKKSFFATAVVAVASALLFCAAQTTSPAPAKRRAQVRLLTREVSLGRIHPGELKETRTLSPDRRRIAFVAKVAGGEAVFVDGVAGKTYPSVENDPLSEAGPGSPITFSPDGRRVAYVAYVGPAGTGARGPRLVVVDGKEGAPFDYVWSGSPHFSADGRRFAYTAERGGKWHAVVDGVESKAFDRVSQPIFSKDGARASFSAERAGRRLIVADGVESDADDPAGPTQLQGATSGSAPREVEQGGKRFVVWEGGKGGPYEEVRDVGRSAAGDRVIFSAKRDGREFAVLDGKEGKPYDDVGSIHISPDGQRVMYVAQLDKKSFVVLDGAEGAKYDSIEVSYPSSFSPDGKRYAYKAARETSPDSREYFVVADGKEGKSYDHVDGIAFDADGRLLYLAYNFSDRKTFLVREGEEVASYDNTPGYGDFKFSPDGKRMFFRLNKLGEGKEALVLDGRAFAYDEIKNAEFGPGGRRFIFKARRAQGWVMVL